MHLFATRTAAQMLELGKQLAIPEAEAAQRGKTVSA